MSQAFTNSSAATHQYNAAEFVESAGLVPFHLSSRRICLIQHPKRNEYLLPKGRRNCTETRAQTALREVKEETGYTCRLLPVKMAIRAPPAVEVEGVHTPDIARVFDEITEPMMLQKRELSADGTKNLKLIWWYIGAINEDYVASGSSSEESRNEIFRARLFSFQAAIDALTFDGDKEVVRAAVAIVEATYGKGENNAKHGLGTGD